VQTARVSNVSKISLDKTADSMYDIRTMKRVNYHLTEDQIKRLQGLAQKTGLSVAEIIRRAVDEFLDRKEKKMKEGNKKSE